MFQFKRLIRRGLYYIQTGASLGGLPLALLNFATIFYYNAIANIQFLKEIFTNFYLFTIIAGVSFTLFFGCLGYIYKRKSKFYTSQVEVDIDANPYMTIKITPNSIPIYESFCELFEREGIDCESVKTLLRNSGSKKYLKETQ